MKITRLRIGNYHQFKDFDLPLVYPEGHAKAGKPLEKVCFIGQSGTGKTSLLELIYGATGITNITTLTTTEAHSIHADVKLFDLAYTNSFSDLGLSGSNFTQSGQKVITGLGKIINDNLSKINTQLIRFPADLFLDFNTPDEDWVSSGEKDKHIYDFSFDKAISVWKFILADIQNYQETELKLRQDISKAVELGQGTQAIEQELKKLKDWQAATPNPIEEIAKKCLNVLLKNFKLHVKTELDFQKKEDIGFIKIEDASGREIPNGLLSTGTKQIILTALPLYLLKPKNTIILFDEPERSLFPDMQRIIVDYYSSFAEDSQFFYATHSPIIASSFEPCERIILYFDENGYVQWKHGTAPIGDDPNDLLKKDFEMTSLMNDQGIAQYKKYLDYKVQIKNEQDPAKKKELVLELTQLAEKYNF
jgi:predicted ATPase